MKYTVALCQMMPSEDKEESKQRFTKMAEEAAQVGADVLVFPEMWPCPYVQDLIDGAKEPEGAETYLFMQEIAKRLGVYLVGGSVPETSNDKIYNTCYVFDREGRQIGKHRKAHMFDIDVPGGITFKESDFITPGDECTVVDTEFGKIGVAVCFDIRFAELHRRMAREGAGLIVLPAVFNKTTGPAHWELSVRMRAVDNQVYFAGVQAARDPYFHFHAWGHSVAADPWGEVIARADEKPALLFMDVDTERIDEIRHNLPIMSGLRSELY